MRAGVAAAARLVAAMLIGGAALLAGNGQQPTFRSSVQTIVVYATVQDRDGRLVPGLTRENFTLTDNGQPAPITTFSSDPQPITVVLLLDMSASMARHFLRVRESTLHFIDALLPPDRLRIATFGDEISLSPHLTGDKTVLRRIAREELWPGGGTPMWNALQAGMDSLAAEGGRRVVLVLTDGEDRSSLSGWKGNLGSVARLATQGGFLLYTIGLEGAFEGDAKKDMARLIGATGGAQLRVGDTEDLKATFTRIAEELRQQYVIGFVPLVSDGAEHRLQVRVDRPDLKVRARDSYIAGQP